MYMGFSSFTHKRYANTIIYKQKKKKKGWVGKFQIHIGDTEPSSTRNSNGLADITGWT